MRVLHVASEVAPFAQSGGLADVLAGLPAALADHGLDVGVMVPLYRGVAEKLEAANLELGSAIPAAVAVGAHRFEASLRPVTVGRVNYGFVQCDALYDRPGTLYGPGGTTEFSDNHLRFAALGKVALEHGHNIVHGPIDILHAHDWQGALAAIYARTANAPIGIVATIHNLAYRGIFPKAILPELGIPWSLFDIHHLEFYDQACLLKGGLAVADAVTTVSPSYAHEILTPQFGEALDGFLRSDVRQVIGIANGIDYTAWNPATDPALAHGFSRSDLAGKAICRRALATEFGLAIGDDQPLIGVIARFTGQKGIDLVADSVPWLRELGAKLVVLGSGATDLEQRFRDLAQTFPEVLGVRIGFDIALSRRVYAGCDLFSMPSRFEPCGIGQLYAMRYGAIPVVHAVGGLRDTVLDPGDAGLAIGGGTGIAFDSFSLEAYLAAMRRAVAVFRNPQVRTAVRATAMSRDSSWTPAAAQYLEVYRSTSALP
jgi:starch synthase